MADVRAFRFGAVIVTLGLAAACGAGPAQRPIDEAPRQFVGEDGAVLAEVLILPMYDVSTGVATRTNDAMRHTYVLTSPFIYGAGARFVVKQPDAAGILVPPNGLFAGRAVLLRGVIAIGPGHRAVWVGELWPEGRFPSSGFRPPSDSRTQTASRSFSHAPGSRQGV